MTKGTVFALLVVGAALVAGGIWFTLSPVSAPPGDRGSSREELSASRSNVLSTEDEVSRAQVGDGSPAATRSELGGDAPFDTEGAIWIEGRVIFPSGTPADERAEVRADFERTGSKIPHRVAVASDGSFRVAFPAGAQSAKLELFARYLFLYEPHRLDLSAPPSSVVLEPDLGGFLHAVLVVDPADEARRGELVGTDLSISVPSGLRTANSWTFPHRTALVEQASHVDAGGLIPGVSYTLAGDPKTFARFELRGIRVEPGTVTSAEILVSSGITIRGRVRSESAEPIANAQFRLVIYNGNETTYSDAASQSGEDGQFELRGVRAGRIRMTVTASDYLATHVRLDEPTDEALEIVLARGKSLRGRVVWPDRTPAAGAEVELDVLSGVGIRDQFHDLRWEDAQRRVAPEDGTFEYHGLTEGPFLLVARAHSETRSGSARIDVVQSDGEPVVLALDEGHAVQGRVVDDTGAPVPSYTVTAAPSVRDEPTWLVDTVTGRVTSDGTFVLDALRAGAWTIVVRGAGGIARRDVTVPGDERALEIVLPRPSGIAGTVVDPAGQPVRGARVACVPKTMPGASEEQRFTANPTGADGRFAIDAVASGPSNITASHFRFATSETETFELVPGQALANLVIPMRPSGRITGEVLDAENRPDPMRSIGLSPRSGRTQISAHTESDAAGRFEFDGVPPGEYSLRTQASEAERELGNHAASNVSQRVEVTVAAGQTAHVVLGGRKRAPVRVSGRISARGRGVAKVTVFASLKSSSKRALTNEDGRYEIALDEPGVYLFNLTLGDSGTRLTRQETVPDALEHAIDFDLPGARIAGRVLTPKGEPARQIEVEMRHSTWADPPSTLRTPFGDVFTGDDGRFAFEHLFAGTYSLHASEALYLGTDQVAQFSPASVETEVAEDATVDDLEIRLEPAGRLDVEVLAPGGERCAGADVFAFGESGAALLHYTGKVTDAAGRMNVTGLPLRDVYVFARKGALASAVVGPVRVGEAELVKLELRPATMLDLSVDTPQGTRPVYASVRNERGIDFARLWSQGGGAIVSGAGGARVGPVPPGRYSVNFANPSPGAQAVDVVVSGEETRAVKLAMPSPPTPND